MSAKHQLEKLKDDYAELHGRAMLYLAERDEARRLARLFWHWAIWLDGEMNSAFCADDMEELERLRVGDVGKYEEWRHIREAGKPDWLKEKP
jgi:hypothetical protein